MTDTSPVLIIGKDGKTGARVNAILESRGVATRPVSRSSAMAFDWNDQATWQAALGDVEIAYVTYQPDLAVPQAEGTIKRFITAAKSAGLKHVVLLSGRGEEGAQRAERVLINSGLTWNVVRASWFFQNFSESFMAEGVVAGHLALPADDVMEPFIDADDIAEVVVAALTKAELNNRIFEITGPEAVTFSQCVEGISKACGRAITYSYIPVEPYIAQLNQRGIPADYQWLLRELFTEVLDGSNSKVTDGVLEVLGRPARSLDDYVRKAVASGVWPIGERVSA